MEQTFGSPRDQARPQQSLGIQAVRLGAPGTAVDLQRTRVHDMAADAVRLEKAGSQNLSTPVGF